MGCIKVRDVKRYASEEDQWDIDRFNSFRGVPWEPTPGSKSCEIKVKLRFQDWQKISELD